MPSPQQRAELRVCASCEWIFNTGICCPKCQFGSYGARHVYGNRCYRFHVTQKPWFDKKRNDYAFSLRQEIMEHLKTIMPPAHKRRTIGVLDLFRQPKE